MMRHLSHQANSAIVPLLVERCRKLRQAVMRLLKLLCSACFEPSAYFHRHRITSGAYGTVYAAHPPQSGHEVIVKLIDIPKRIHDRCVLRELFNEITVLERVGDGNTLVCQLYDYGIDHEYAYLVLHSYQCSLRSWREQQKGPLTRNVLLYMWIFERCALAVQALHQRCIAHFDIKCDNILLEQKGGDQDPFTVAIADFGESKTFAGLDPESTFRSHGTEYIMSPEMLTVAMASHKEAGHYDRRRKQGAGRASDVWSLGCLFFELLTGEMLFFDPNWTAFFCHITDPKTELINETAQSKMGHDPDLISFLRFILVRDADRRPTIEDVLVRCRHTQEALQQRHKLPVLDNMAEKVMFSVSADAQAALQAEFNRTSPKLREHALARVSCVDARLFIGTIQHAADWCCLRALGISHLVLFEDYAQVAAQQGQESPGFVSQIVRGKQRDEFSPAVSPRLAHSVWSGGAVDQEAFQIEVMPLEPEPEPDHGLCAYFERAVRAIHSFTKAGWQVMICSREGKSRAPAVAIAYLMATKQMSCFQAYNHVRGCRIMASPRLSLVRGLLAWEAQGMLPELSSSSTPAPAMGPSASQRLVPLGDRVLVKRHQRKGYHREAKGLEYGRVEAVGSEVQAPLGVGAYVMVPEGGGDEVDGALAFFKASELVSVVAGATDDEFEFSAQTAK